MDRVEKRGDLSPSPGPHGGHGRLPGARGPVPREITELRGLTCYLPVEARTHPISTARSSVNHG